MGGRAVPGTPKPVGQKRPPRPPLPSGRTRCQACQQVVSTVDRTTCPNCGLSFSDGVDPSAEAQNNLTAMIEKIAAFGIIDFESDRRIPKGESEIVEPRRGRGAADRPGEPEIW